MHTRPQKRRFLLICDKIYVIRWGQINKTKELAAKRQFCNSRKNVNAVKRSFTSMPAPRSWELRIQKLKSDLMRTQSLNVLPLKPGVGQYIAVHATLTDREFFLAYFYPSNPFTCIFFKNISQFFPVLVVANTDWFLCRPAEENRSPCWMQVPALSARGIW